jgi:predicted Zn-dependent protease
LLLALLFAIALLAGPQAPETLRSGQDWWSEGTSLYDADRYADAARAFAQLTALRPDSGSAFAMLGLCEYKLGQFDQALVHVEKGRRLGLPEDLSLRRVVAYHYGVLLLEKGRFEDGQKQLDALGRDKVESEGLKRALGCAVLRFRPSHVPGANTPASGAIKAAGQAEVLASRDDPGARSAYEQLVSQYGTVRNVQYAYGRFLLTLRDNERAIAAFKKELANTPDHVLARLAIADILRTTDPGASVPFAEAAVRLAPRLPTAHYVLGMSLLDNGRTAEAVRELELAREELPDQARIYYALARGYNTLGRKEDASRASREFTRLKAAEQKDLQP